MPIGWMTVLQSVPWGEVVSNAPKIAAGAKKLWKSVASKPAANVDEASVSPGQLNLSPQAQAMAAMQLRIESLESATAQLHAQLTESSGLITALAEQNTQLIARIEKIRVRMIWLGGLLSVAVLAAITGLVLQSPG